MWSTKVQIIAPFLCVLHLCGLFWHGPYFWSFFPCCPILCCSSPLLLPSACKLSFQNSCSTICSHRTSPSSAKSLCSTCSQTHQKVNQHSRLLQTWAESPKRVVSLLLSSRPTIKAMDSSAQEPWPSLCQVMFNWSHSKHRAQRASEATESIKSKLPSCWADESLELTVSEKALLLPVNTRYLLWSLVWVWRQYLLTKKICKCVNPWIWVYC